MITQEKFLNTLTQYRQVAEKWGPSIWGEDTKDLLQFIERLIVDVKSLGDNPDIISLEENVWMNSFVAGMIMEFFGRMRPSGRFEPHLSYAKSLAKYLFVYMPNDRTGIKPKLFCVVRDNIMAYNISRVMEISPSPVGDAK